MASPLLPIFLTAALAAAAAVRASPPEPVVTCISGNTNCTVTNYYAAFSDRSTCLVSAVAYPSDEAELLRTVSSAASRKQHMKVVTVHSHSVPKLACPGGPEGSGLVISTVRLNKVVSVDEASNLVTVEPGMTLREFVDAAAKRGLALPHAPYWDGVTIGGLLGTGAHGSSLFGKGSAVHEYVVGMRVVVPTSTPVLGLHAKVIRLSEADEDLLAAKVSLGVLGVISQITFQLQPMFKRSITYRSQTDVEFESTIASFTATTEFGDISWFPSQSRVVYRDDVRLPITAKGEGMNDYVPFQQQSPLVAASIRAREESQEAWEDARGKCSDSKSIASMLVKGGGGLKNNDGSHKEFHGYPVIGNQNVMQTSGSCLNGSDNEQMCAWDPRIKGSFFYVTAITIPLTSISSFISDVRKLRDADPDSLCGLELYSGILLRFIRNSTAYLGKTVDSVSVEMMYYRSRDPLAPRLFEDAMEEIEQMLLFKYNGLPHMGKNRNVAFLGLRGKLGAKVDKFVEVMGRFDPDGLFSSEWSDAVLGLRGKSVVVDKPRCALDGLCICSRDEHCAPDKGYLCRGGVVYAEARVCRKVKHQCMTQNSYVIVTHCPFEFQ